jgi:SET domain-containing protein
MLTVKTIVRTSEIEGLGLFAAEKIPKGTAVWVYDPRFDISFEPEEVKKFDQLKQTLINRYAYFSPESKKYIYCIDDSRFMNHSAKNPNLDIVHIPGEIETRAIANRDIELGEEITVNYREIDIVDAQSSEEYLNT